MDRATFRFNNFSDCKITSENRCRRKTFTDLVKILVGTYKNPGIQIIWKIKCQMGMFWCQPHQGDIRGSEAGHYFTDFFLLSSFLLLSLYSKSLSTATRQATERLTAAELAVWATELTVLLQY